jgi:hypothetical protein
MTMISSEVQRTLVKSPPELWSELSDPGALARHLGELGEIKITRTEPEKLVEWEAEGTTGTVAIKASGWGTKVILTVHHEPPAPAVAEPEDEPDASAKAQDDVEQERAGDEPAAVAPQQPGPSAEIDPAAGAAEVVSEAEPKPAPATEAARRSAGWPDARGHAGPAIESDLRAAEADAPVSEHAPWHLEEAEHALQAESAGEPQPETESPPPESRRGFFARLFGSRRKRADTAVAEAREATDLAAEQPLVTQPVADVPEPATVSHTQVVAENIQEQPDTDAALDTLADTSAPEAPVEATEPVALAEPEPADSAVARAEPQSPEPSATSEPEPPAASDDLAAELKAAEEVAAEQVKAVLTSVLDRLGAAHHRPFSRA